MRIIHFDFSDQLQIDQFFAYQLKVAYILSDVLNAVGNCPFAITFEKSQATMTIDEKVYLVDKVENADEELKGLIELYFEVRKNFKSMKHPPNNIFLNYKNVQNAMGIALKTWESSLIDYFKKAGYIGLLNVCAKNVFDIYYLEDGEESEGRLNNLDLLTNKSPKNAIDNSIWSMPTWFYVDNFFDKQAISDIKSISDKKPYFIKCLDLPNINFISIAELTAIKNQISSSIQNFKAKTDLWAQQCYQTKGGATYFKENIYPIIPSIQKVIDDNPIIQHCLSQPAGSVKISLFLGEVTPPILWKYYLYFKQITEMEYNNLMNGYKSLKKYTIPVLLFMNVNSDLKLTTLPKAEAEIIVPQTDVLAVRKHINID